MDTFQPGNLRSIVDCSDFAVMETQFSNNVVSMMAGELNIFISTFAAFDRYSMSPEAVGIQQSQISSDGHCMERGVDGTNMKCAQKYGTEESIASKRGLFWAHVLQCSSFLHFNTGIISHSKTESSGWRASQGFRIINSITALDRAVTVQQSCTVIHAQQCTPNHIQWHPAIKR